VSAPLDGVRVLELTDESAEYCGRLLAGLGADVVKVEPPAGAPSRHIGPFLDDEPGLDRSLAFWADNVGKRSVVVDDDEDIVALCGAADVLVHTLRPAQAVARGQKMGRPPKLTPHQRREAVKRRDRGGESLADIGRSYNVSQATISRLL